MVQELLAPLLLLTAAVAAVALARHFRVPTILAYLSVGIALGPQGARVLGSSDAVDAFAEFGVVFLMFSIGLEFSLAHLLAMRRLVFGFGAAQMATTAAGSALVTWIGYDQGWRAGLAVGLAVGMSSTAIVAKVLSERFELHSRSGRQTMGVLLFQDLAVVPCLVLFPALAQAQAGGDLGRTLAIALLQAVVLLSVMIWSGQRLLKPLYDHVAARRSEELFVLTTLWLVVGLATLTAAAGLSLALGAFVGGMLISETAYRHQVESDMRPFRDILLGLFFVTVGMLLDLRFVFANLHLLALALFLLVAGKGLVVLLVALPARTPLPVALRTAAQLAQAGEFGLVLIELARQHRLIADDVFQVTLSAMLMSMFLAPFLIERAARFSGELAKGDWAHEAKKVHDIAAASMAVEQHVIICGYGRTGQSVGRFLAAEGIAFLALDLDPAAAQAAVPAGSRLVFGGADRAEVLRAAGLARARAVVIAYPDVLAAERALREVRRQSSDVPVIVRAADEHDIERLKAAGANEVIPEVVEGSLMLAAEALAQLGVPFERAIGRVRLERAQRYGRRHTWPEHDGGATLPPRDV